MKLASKRLFKMTYQWRDHYALDNYVRTSGEMALAAETIADAARRAPRIAKQHCKQAQLVYLRVTSLVDQGVIR